MKDRILFTIDLIFVSIITGIMLILFGSFLTLELVAKVGIWVLFISLLALVVYIIIEPLRKNTANKIK